MAQARGGTTIGGNPAMYQGGPVTASMGTINGRFSVLPLATPAAPTVTPQGTTGATTYYYWVVAVDRSGYKTTVSPVGSTATGNATLSGTDFNRVSWAAVPYAYRYDLLRTTTNVAPTGTVSVAVATNIQGTSYDDIGAALTSYAVTASNVTGDATFGGDIYSTPGRMKSNNAFGFYTNASGAQTIMVGALLASNVYNDISQMPANGVYAKGQVKTAGGISLSGATSNVVEWGTAGVAAPSFTTRSVGTKLVLYPSVNASNADYGFGVDTGTLWASVNTTGSSFKWYGGTTLAATLSGTGFLTLVGNVAAQSFTAGSAAGRGFSFWNNDLYKVYMSGSSDATWGGRIAGETTSDYNMYFRMSGGTNRGFVFLGDNTSNSPATQPRLMAINPDGVRVEVPFTAAGAVTADSFTGSVATTNLTGTITDTQHGERGGGNLHALATTSTAGFMSAADKVALDNMVASPGGVTSFNTRTGAITLSSADVTNALGFTPENASLKGANNGYASLDANGKIPTSQLPALAISDTFVVASQAAMLALTAERGDVAVRTDLNKSFILQTDGAETLANWQELLTPTDAVLSVNGQTGAVTLTTAHIAEGTNLYWTQTRFDTAFTGKSTSNLGEGTNLYFTTARADARITAALASTTPAALGTAAVGTGTTLARADHVHQMPTAAQVGALPTGTTTSGIEEGTNLYYTDARADARITAKLSSTTPAALGTAAVGTGTTLARADHVHAMPTATQVGAIATSALTTTVASALGAAATAGSSTNVARVDHVHPFPTAANVGAIATSALTATAPAALGASAAAGSSTNVARIDHVHPYPTAAQVGAAAASHAHTSLGQADTRAVVSAPSNSTAAGTKWDFKAGASTGLSGAYASVQTISQWADDSGGPVHELAFNNNGEMYYRFGLRTGADTWSAWRTILNSESNLDSSKLTATTKLNLVPTATGSLPAATTVGVAYDSTLEKLVVANGTEWVPVGSGSSAYTAPIEIGPTVAGQATYTLPGSKLYPIVYLGSVVQGDDKYTVNGDGTITFVSAPTTSGISVKASVVVALDIEGAGGGAMSSPVDIGVGDNTTLEFGPLPGTGENPWVFVGSALQIKDTHYTVNGATRMITFTEAPASGVVVSASAMLLPMIGTDALTLNGATASISNVVSSLPMRDGVGRVTAASVKTAVRVCTTTPVTATTSDHVLSVKLTVPEAVLVNLPTNPDPGQEIIVKDRMGAFAYHITVTTTDGILIDGETTSVLDRDNVSRVFKFDGVEWIVL